MCEILNYGKEKGRRAEARRQVAALGASSTPEEEAAIHADSFKTIGQVTRDLMENIRQRR